MIHWSERAAAIVTRGDVDLTDALAPLAKFSQIEVWDNSKAAEDLSVYGRYAALEAITKPVVLVQDDDVALSDEAVTGLIKAYVPGRIVAIMPREYRERYTDSCLVGFGAIFDKDLPEKAFARFREHAPATDEQWFRRTCDVVFTTLTPFVCVDFPFTYLPHTRAANRMYKQPGNTAERQKMLHLARAVRDVRKGGTRQT